MHSAINSDSEPSTPGTPVRDADFQYRESLISPDSERELINASDLEERP